jgi:ergothioneine biosynthesis protein EgtB
VRAGADALYHSSRVAHDTRWALPLPDAAATRADLEAQLQRTLELLAAATEDDDALYFFRLALLHEDMHHEAALYMAQGLGIAIDDARWQAAPLPPPGEPLAFEAGDWRLGHEGPGFAFDNELGAHTVALAPTVIDRQAVRWAEFLPFVEAGGYAEPRWWSDAGRAWLTQTKAQPAPAGATQPAAPRHLRRTGSGWHQWRHGRWIELNLALPACHLTFFEAQAWCAWAGRRLPTEAEWERAALQRPDAFCWGDVWEWTASPFAPFPGFTPHPYRDYSAPWFDGRPVLRGASYATQPRLRHPRYRNYFTPERNDIFAGFRSCAL